MEKGTTRKNGQVWLHDVQAMSEPCVDVFSKRLLVLYAEMVKKNLQYNSHI
jgi:hypothetical protein